MIKQQNGKYLAIGGEPKEIYPLYLSLFNWGGVGRRTFKSRFSRKDGELLNLGFPEKFVYFLIEPEYYVYYRAVALVAHLRPQKKGVWGGNWDEACDIANKELDSMVDEVFLNYGVFSEDVFDLEEKEENFAEFR